MLRWICIEQLVLNAGFHNYTKLIENDFKSEIKITIMQIINIILHKSNKILTESASVLDLRIHIIDIIINNTV